MALTIQFTVENKGNDLTLNVTPILTGTELPNPIETALVMAMKKAAVDVFDEITHGVLEAVDTVRLSGDKAKEAAELHEKNKQHPQQEPATDHDIHVEVTL